MRSGTVTGTRAVTWELRQQQAERLSPIRVLIRWGSVGGPSMRSISAFPGEGITVGGAEARLKPTQPATGACLGRAGAIQAEGTVLRPNAADNFLQLDACFGPDANVTAADATFRGRKRNYTFHMVFVVP
jgi:hypothetical protein